MHKALYIRELGSGDAKTHTFKCKNYAEVYAIKPPKNHAGDRPLVYYNDGSGWKVACYQSEDKNSKYQGWRDMDAIFDDK